jgi:GNAT superfamily N-acetyltransferase
MVTHDNLRKTSEDDGIEFTYVETLDGVDWEEMKRALAEDNFDNGRTPAQLATSFRNSVSIIAYAAAPNRPPRLIGTARALTDGICNAYVVDVWTHSDYRRRGVARTMLTRLLRRLPGQHVYLWTDSAPDFYTRLGFEREASVGMATVVGEWLNNAPLPD